MNARGHAHTPPAVSTYNITASSSHTHRTSKLKLQATNHAATAHPRRSRIHTSHLHAARAHATPPSVCSALGSTGASVRAPYTCTPSLLARTAPHMILGASARSVCVPRLQLAAPHYRSPLVVAHSSSPAPPQNMRGEAAAQSPPPVIVAMWSMCLSKMPLEDGKHRRAPTGSSDRKLRREVSTGSSDEALTPRRSRHRPAAAAARAGGQGSC